MQENFQGGTYSLNPVMNFEKAREQVKLWAKESASLYVLYEIQGRKFSYQDPERVENQIQILYTQLRNFFEGSDFSLEKKEILKEEFKKDSVKCAVELGNESKGYYEFMEKNSNGLIVASLWETINLKTISFFTALGVIVFFCSVCRN